MEELSQNRKCLIILTVFIVLSNIADILVDWLFYSELNALKKGLVFGPPDPRLLHATLTFAIISSILNVIEIIYNLLKTIRGISIINPETISLLTIWFGELPLVIINVVTSACREESLSIFQLSKASVILFGNLIRLLFFFVSNYKNCVCGEKLKRKLFFLICLAGLLLNILGSSTIFIFSHTRSNSPGEISIDTPKTFFDEIQDHEQYFKGVSIYYKDTSFQPTSNPNQEFYIRLLRIDDLRKKDKETISINYQFYEQNQNVQIAISKKIARTPWLKPERYLFNKSSNLVSVLDTSDEMKNFTKSVSFTFDFLPPDGIVLKEYIFGEILYNAKVTDGTYCKSGDDIPVKYIRSELSEKNHLVMDNEAARFYTMNDLTDIKSVWKTGMLKCDSTGSLQPSLDKALTVPCVDWAM